MQSQLRVKRGTKVPKKQKVICVSSPQEAAFEIKDFLERKRPIVVKRKQVQKPLTMAA